MLENILNWDKEALLSVNGAYSGFWDAVMYYTSYKFTWIPLYFFLLLILIKQYRMRTFEVLIFIILLITITDQVSVRAFKDVFMRLRPCQDPAIKDMVHLVKGECGGLYGFVSSHAANTFALAVFLALTFQGKSKFFLAGLLIWATFVSFSRVYLGAHYPLDIICGALLGSIIAFMLFFVFRWYFNKNVFGFQNHTKK